MQGECRTQAEVEQLRREIRAKYRDVAEQPEGRFPYPVGRASLARLGYPPEWLQSVPSEVVDRFVGVGNPFQVHTPAPGGRVLDVGCGCGLDVFVAAGLVGPGGSAAGLDLTSEMLELPRRCAGRWALNNVAFEEGMIESLPFEDASFDTVISNGVLNLVPDKDAAFREILRVLRPGGVLAAADLLVTETVPESVLAGMNAWST